MRSTFIAALLLLLSTVFVPCGNAAHIDLTPEEEAWLADHPVIRVGGTELLQPLIETGHEEQHQGIIPDLFSVIATMLGVEITYIVEDWPSVLKDAASGKIDVVGLMNSQVAKEKGLIPVDAPIGFLTTAFARRDSSFTLEKDSDIKGLRVAYFRNIYYLQDYLDNLGESVQAVPCDSPVAAMQAVLENRADIMLGMNFDSYLLTKHSITELAPIHVFSSLPVNSAMAVRPTAPVLASILAKVGKEIPFSQRTEILARWSWIPDSSLSPESIGLTEQEMEYLRNKGELTMCTDPDWLPFEKLENGKHIGMAADYFELLRKAIGIPIRVVDTTSWLETLAFGKSRKCDIFSMAMETPDRRTWLNFTESYFKTPIVLATEIHRPWISDIRDISRNKRIGVIAGYSYAELLRRKYPKMQLIDVKSMEEGLDMVGKGELYGLIGTLPAIGYHIQHNHIGQIRITGKFKEEWTLGVATRNDEPLLLSIFNKAIKAIPQQEHARILNKWVSVASSPHDPTVLTEQEKAYLENHPVIRFRTRTNRPPFEFERNGKPAGIAVDYIRTIADKVGFKAEFVFDDRPPEEAFKEIEGDRKDFDTVLFSVKSDERSERLLFGDAYLSYPMMVVVNKNTPYVGSIGNLREKIVVLEKGFLTNEWLARDFPDINVINTPDTKSALEMLNDGSVDAYVGNLAIANYMMAYGGLDNIKVAAPTPYGQIEYRFVASRQDAPLISILNKGFRRISPMDHSTIHQHWFTLQTIEKRDYGPLWKTVGAAILIFCWILWWNRKLKLAQVKTEDVLVQLQQAHEELEQKNEELRKVSVTDKLTGLKNRARIEEILEEEHRRFNRYAHFFSVIMLDLDHFKKVNDTYGHLTGDKLLVEMSRLFESNVRDVDSVGRWGGEEFLIVCPDTRIEGAVKAAEKLRKAVAGHTFDSVGAMTVSIGVATVEYGDTVESLVSRADDALYISKDMGRNKVSSQ